MAAESALGAYLEEDVAGAIAVGLRRHGCSVTTTQEADMLGAADADQLTCAASQKRAVVTYNQGEFCRLHAEYLRQSVSHSGIIIASRKAGVGETLSRLVRLLGTVAAGDMQDQINWLSEFASDR